MRLFRFGETGNEKPGAVTTRGRRVDVSKFGEDYDEAFFATDGIRRLQQWMVKNESRCREVPSEARMGPCVLRPSKIVGIGLNYANHAKEAGAAIPAEPVLFMKATTSINGPNDDIVLPPGSLKTDWEVELAIVIGKRASHVEEEDAMDHVAGYTIINDVSERAHQIEGTGQWTKGKSADTFAPLGPYLVTREAIADPQNLKLSLSVNGEVMQESNTSDMVFGVKYLVSYVSRYMTLLPGDVIATGTPAGVGLGRKPQRFLKSGDVVELEIENLGRQRQQVVSRDR
ncbi:MAG: fumarylacetoacetate hydrolase family protein [Cytophagales bacterium]|nr:fumarylacetoacetate hydrolase family protein [Cytophagales bacterium]